MSLGTLLAGLGLAAVTAAPTANAAALGHPTLVSTNPVNVTPNVMDDARVRNARIHALAQSGDTMYAAGKFQTTTNARRTITYPRNNIMAFDATTGAMHPFAPNFGGVLWALAPSGSSLFVGGDFGFVNGVARRGLVKVDATTGRLISKFRPVIPSGRVTELKIVGNRLIVGGSFPKRLMAVDLTTGADTNYINLGISGTVATDRRPTQVYRYAINPAGTRLMAIGNFTRVSGQSRPRAVMIDLDADKARLNPWRYGPMANRCAAASLPDQMTDVDFSPDGSYFVMVATGFIPARTSEIGFSICDAAARFETANPSPTKPTWINYTGGDTLYSVAITGAAVYVQGHQRWLDNPRGVNSAGPGAVARPGIGAISPSTGRALSWNPTKDRNVGGKDFLVTSAGLWVASDGRFFNRETRWGVAFCPLP